MWCVVKIDACDADVVQNIQCEVFGPYETPNVAAAVLHRMSQRVTDPYIRFYVKQLNAETPA